MKRIKWQRDSLLGETQNQHAGFSPSLSRESVGWSMNFYFFDHLKLMKTKISTEIISSFAANSATAGII